MCVCECGDEVVCVCAVMGWCVCVCGDEGCVSAVIRGVRECGDERCV